MSTNLAPVDPISVNDLRVSLTQYAGPGPVGASKLRLQLTQANHFVTLSREQAADLAGALAEWLADIRPEVY